MRNSRILNRLREEGYVVSVTSKGTRIGRRKLDDTIEGLRGEDLERLKTSAIEKSDSRT